MKVAIVPHIDHLIVIVNSHGKVPLEASSSAISKLYVPWPDAQEKGFAEIEIEGDTLRAVLTKIGAIYKQANIDLEPICPTTNDVKLDYDVFVNGNSFVLLNNGLESKLRDGDAVKILADTQGFC
jgi:molybdopterin converting factor small subunit